MREDFIGFNSLTLEKISSTILSLENLIKLLGVVLTGTYLNNLFLTQTKVNFKIQFLRLTEAYLLDFSLLGKKFEQKMFDILRFLGLRGYLSYQV